MPRYFISLFEQSAVEFQADLKNMELMSHTPACGRNENPMTPLPS